MKLFLTGFHVACWLANNNNRCPYRPDGRDLRVRLANVHLEGCRNTSTSGGNDLVHASWHPLQNRFTAEHRKLTAQCLQTIIIIVPTDPIGVICTSDLPKWTWWSAGTPPHPGATTWFVLLDTHLQNPFATDFAYKLYSLFRTRYQKYSIYTIN